MDFQRELDAALLEDVQNRVPAIGEELETLFNGRIRHGRERVQEVPDRRASETVHDLDPQVLCGPGGVFHLLDGPFGFLLGVAANRGRHPVVGPRVVVIEHELARQVIRDGPALQAMLTQKLMAPLAVAGLVEGFLHIEVIAPAR